MRRGLLVLMLLTGCRPGAPAPAAAPARRDVASAPGIDIRSVDGAVIVAAADILEYEWATHTMMWRPGVMNRVFQARRNELINGSPFTVCAGGRPVYRGVFTSMFSSNTQETVVIVIRHVAEDEQGRLPDAARLQLGFPNQEWFAGTDPRGDPAIRAALNAAGKLK